MVAKLSPRRAVALAAVGVAVAVGGAAAVAAATGNSPSPSTFLDSVAKHLGISRDKLDDAVKAAAIDQVNAAQQSGRITKAEADQLKSRIESGEVPPFLGAIPFRHFGGHLFGFEDRLSSAAGYLGLTEEALLQKLRAGQTLAAIANGQGKTVSGLEDAILAGAKARLDDAVSAGRLTQGQADQILSDVRARLDDLVNGHPPDFRGFGLRRPFGFGFFGDPRFRHGFGFAPDHTAIPAAPDPGLSL
jgi:hypothetical protein